MTSQANRSPFPFTARRRVVLLDGESEGGSLSDHLLDVRALFDARGFETVLIDLKRADSNAELVAQVQSGLVRFCYGLSGFGAELSVTHAEGTSNFWEFVRTPYVGVMPDSPVFMPARHRLSSAFILFLYSDPTHLEIGAAIGSGTTDRALIGHSGFAPASAPATIAARDIAVLYAKAGGDPEKIRESWQADAPAHGPFIEEVIDACCWNADVSIWHVAREIASTRPGGSDVASDAFCYCVCQCELYVRRARASRALHELLRFPVHVAGGDWTHLDWAGAKAQLGARVPLTELRALFGRSKIVLNTMPALRFSTHHRVVEGMLHGAAAASDSNSWLDSAATRDRYVAFDWSPGAVAHAIDTALADDAALGELAERGRAFAVEYHDRDAHFNHMLKTVDTFLERAGRSGG
jgi:glycosyl transferase family 1